MYYKSKAIVIDMNVPSVCGAREKYMSHKEYEDTVNGNWICCNTCWKIMGYDTPPI